MWKGIGNTALIVSPQRVWQSVGVGLLILLSTLQVSFVLVFTAEGSHTHCITYPILSHILYFCYGYGIKRYTFHFLYIAAFREKRLIYPPGPVFSPAFVDIHSHIHTVIKPYFFPVIAGICPAGRCCSQK